MVCDLLDLRCIFVNELIGSTMLALVFGAIFYFMMASKLRLGFQTTIVFAIPLLLMLGLAISGLQVIFVFATIFVGLTLAWIFNRIIRNR